MCIYSLTQMLYIFYDNSEICFPFQHIANCPFQKGRRCSSEDLFFFTKVEVITNGVQRDHSIETVGVINNPFASFTKSTKTKSSVKNRFCAREAYIINQICECRMAKPSKGIFLLTTTAINCVLSGCLSH